MNALIPLGCLCLGVATLSAELHDFKSADGSKSFSGELIAYDAATKTVTVNSQRSTKKFSIDVRIRNT